MNVLLRNAKELYECQDWSGGGERSEQWVHALEGGGGVQRKG